MKRILVSGIVISCSLIFSQSFAEDAVIQESSNEKLIEETGEQDKVNDTVNEDTKIQEKTVEVQTEETECQEKQIQNISISNSSIQSIDTDFNQIAESTMDKITEIAEELDLKDFDVTMTDQYATRNGYSMDTYEYSASFSMSFQSEKKAFGAFLKKLSPINLSSSITKQECED
jgi:hypothetical protein